nr:ATP-binding protein [Pseudomonas syringae]
MEERYQERIFEFGETQKVGGRGMGLAISREALQKEGFELELVQFGINKNLYSEYPLWTSRKRKEAKNEYFASRIICYYGSEF